MERWKWDALYKLRVVYRAEFGNVNSFTLFDSYGMETSCWHDARVGRKALLCCKILPLVGRVLCLLELLDSLVYCTFANVSAAWARSIL